MCGGGWVGASASNTNAALKVRGKGVGDGGRNISLITGDFECVYLLNDVVTIRHL